MTRDELSQYLNDEDLLIAFRIEPDPNHLMFGSGCRIKLSDDESLKGKATLFPKRYYKLDFLTSEMKPLDQPVGQSTGGLQVDCSSITHVIKFPR